MFKMVAKLNPTAYGEEECGSVTDLRFLAYTRGRVGLPDTQLWCRWGTVGGGRAHLGSVLRRLTSWVSFNLQPKSRACCGPWLFSASPERAMGSVACAQRDTSADTQSVLRV